VPFRSIGVLKRSVGTIVIGPMPDRASTKPDQNLSRVLPIGETTPIPVTTTRFIQIVGNIADCRKRRRHSFQFRKLSRHDPILF
jgi:hypothetical protein